MKGEDKEKELEILRRASSVKEVCLTLGICRERVRQLYEQHNIPKPYVNMIVDDEARKKIYFESASKEAAAEEMGISVQGLHAYARHRDWVRDWPKEEKFPERVEAFQNSTSYMEASKKLGMRFSAFYAWAKKSGHLYPHTESPGAKYSRYVAAFQASRTFKEVSIRMGNSPTAAQAFGRDHPELVWWQQP